MLAEPCCWGTPRGGCSGVTCAVSPPIPAPSEGSFPEMRRAQAERGCCRQQPVPSTGLLYSLSTSGCNLGGTTQALIFCSGLSGVHHAQAGQGCRWCPALALGCGCPPLPVLQGGCAPWPDAGACHEVSPQLCSSFAAQCPQTQPEALLVFGFPPSKGWG